MLVHISLHTAHALTLLDVLCTTPKISFVQFIHIFLCGCSGGAKCSFSYNWIQPQEPQYLQAFQFMGRRPYYISLPLGSHTRIQGEFLFQFIYLVFVDTNQAKCKAFKFLRFRGWQNVLQNGMTCFGEHWRAGRMPLARAPNTLRNANQNRSTAQ